MSKLEAVRFAAGTQLFAQGQVPEAMYFVLQGTVELANEHTDLVGQGALVGAVAFLNQIPSRFRARCVTDTDLFKLNEENIITLFRTHPQIGYKILQALASEVVGATHEAEKTEAKPEPLPDGIDQVLPPDHPHFSETAPEAFESLMLHTEAVCPLCDARFAAARVRETRLASARVNPDFRIVYHNMEPLWYYIWVCPECGFAHPYKQFNKVSRRQLEKLKKAVGGDKQIQFRFSPRRTLNEVFLSYYLALRIFAVINAGPEQFGNLWMRLVWLYEDVKAQEWVEYAARNALKHFEEALISGRRSDAGDQKLYIIIAELHQRLGQREDALRCLLEAVNLRAGSEGYRKLAADRIQDLRAEK